MGQPLGLWEQELRPAAHTQARTRGHARRKHSDHTRVNMERISNAAGTMAPTWDHRADTRPLCPRPHLSCPTLPLPLCKAQAALSLEPCTHPATRGFRLPETCL